MKDKDKTKKQLLEELAKLRRQVAELEKPGKELLDAKAEYERTFDAIIDPIAIMDDQFRILRLNKAMAEKLGIPRKEAVGQTCYKMVHGTNEPPSICPHAQLLEDGQEHSVDIYEKNLGGDCLVSVSPIRDTEGRLIGSVHVVHDITNRKRAEETLRKRTHDLGERVKELNCLYGASKLMAEPDLSSDEVLQGIVNLLPPSWQYPEITCARVTIEGRHFTTDTFSETGWKQSTDILVSGKKMGSIEVYYLQEKPPLYEGPFLKEERDLIDALARRIGKFTERKESEKQLAYLSLAAEWLGEMIIVTDLNHKITYANRAVEDILGYKHEEIIDRDAIEFFDGIPGNPPDLEKWIKDTREKEAWRGELFNRKKDGSLIKVHLTLNWLKDKNGEIIGCIGNSMDITEREKAEQVIKGMKEQYERLIENIPDAIYSALPEDAGTMVTYMSDRGEDWTGCSPEDFYKDPEAWSKCIHPDDRDETMKAFIEAYENKHDYIHEYRVINKRTGQVHYIRDHGVPIPDEKGKIIRFDGIVTDITKRKEAETQLNEMFARIEKSHDDMLSILNQLRLSTAITDEKGNVTFLSQAGQSILGTSQKEAVGKHWEELFPFQKEDRAALKTMSELPLPQRTKVSVRMDAPGRRQYWIEVNVYDDPRNSKRKIFFLYDMSEIYRLRRQLDEKEQFHDLVGKSKPMQLIYQQIREVSKVDWVVLIEGETGSGKELVARAIHFSSHRKNKPFLAVNCAMLTDSLLASQLFGHKRGAFTGAVEDHAGLFEAASGGTLFLDEIGDMPLNIQTSILRAIEENEITRLGESIAKKVDIRIIAATHRDLSKGVTKGTFREDLFYRIRVARIQIPPLREHREDIPLLVTSFLDKCRAASGKPVQDISNEAMRKLLDYYWPGNVRELRSAIEFAVTRCDRAVLQAGDLPPEITGTVPTQLQFAGVQPDERQRILDGLRQAGGKRTLAARLLGISRATLYRRMAEFDL